MGLSEEIKETLKEREKHFSKDNYFIELRDFYMSMLKKGIAIKKEYELPSPNEYERQLHSTGFLSAESSEPR